MVSVGTIFSVLVVGAAIAGGIAVYSNANKIGGAFTRGVEKNISNPFGNYLDNLWKIPGINAQGSSAVSTPGNTTTPGALDYVPSTNNPADTRTWSPGYVPPASQDFLPPAKTTTAAPGQPKAGYYYFDVKGSKYDTQQFLTADKAKQFINAKGAFHPEALRAITYIGPNQLQSKGFQVFGQSKGYL